jgi:hypothetical protein
MHSYVRRSAERAICVGVGAVRVGVRDLHGARHRNQKHTDQREEDPQWMRCASSLAVLTHARSTIPQSVGDAFGRTETDGHTNWPGRPADLPPRDLPACEMNPIGPLRCAG